MESPSNIDYFLAFISGLALTISIFSYIASRRATKANTYSEVMGRLFELNRLEIENPGLFQSLYNEFDESKIKEGGQDGVSHYFFMLFNLYSEVFFLNEEHKLLSKAQFKIWESRIENDFKNRPFLKGYWQHEAKNFSNEYTKSFTIFINERIRKAGGIDE